MARTTLPLTNTQIKNAKAKTKEYSLADGRGLALRIKPNGSRLWIFNYSKPFTKKRANMSFGMFPDLSLAEARELSGEARGLLAKNIDPKQDKDEKAEKAAFADKLSLQLVAQEWLKVKRSKVSNEHAEDIWRSLEIHIFPRLGKLPIHLITAPKVIATLRPLEAKGSLETVKRQCQRINEIMWYAVNNGLLETNLLVGIKEAFMAPTKNNFPTIEPHQLPQLMRDLNKANIKRVTRCLIEWQLQTMVRPGEAAGTRWDEIDITEEVWHIPAKRMKKKRDHKVPLSPQMLKLLEIMYPITGHREHLFCGDRNPRASINKQTANMVLKRMGYGGKLVAHGMRSVASTILNEHQFPSDIIEVALAHVDKNENRDDYNKAKYLELRRKMMCWWSDYVQQAADGNLSLAQA